MGLIKLRKSITPDALAAMSRNTIVEGGAVNAEVLKAFQKLLNERLEKISNEPLRKAVEEAVREQALEKLLTATPKQVKKIVDDSFNDITKALGATPKKPRAPRKRTATPRYYGGK